MRQTLHLNSILLSMKTYLIFVIKMLHLATDNLMRELVTLTRKLDLNAPVNESPIFSPAELQ